MTKSSKTYLIFGFLLVLSFNWDTLSAQGNDDRIQPYQENGYYWQYKGEPVILLGGTDDDNLFQMPNLREHLEELREAGGNYIRNTMSDRRAGGFEEYPFQKLANGMYDLDQWNEGYWQRFENMLRLTSEMDIIVQIEVWDRFDYSRENWPPHPYNPANNINYNYEDSGFQPEYPEHPGANEQPFFFTTPDQQNNQIVLQYQQKFVNKLLDHTMEYPNVLYCIDNETSGEEAWAIYWAEFIRDRADTEKRKVNITQMWDDWDLTAEEHRRTIDHPDRFDFLDVSQNNHQTDETHWENFLWVRNYIESEPRPINSVKIYGADGGRHGGDNIDAVEKFWRLIFAGAASARFHRPESGLGLQELSKTQLRSARMFLDEFNIFSAEPDSEHKQLSNRGEDEAYLTRIQGNQYAVFFTNGGDVNVNLPEADGSWQVRWLDISKSNWTENQSLNRRNSIHLKAPGDGHWVAVISKM
ncbi:MAG: hypothetical protein RI575_13690 [Balneolaceae bacterium]|nr:hypothetical protein [Balneolaceae bacterium]MDR9408412.1 hypothetical protein [Balneolaceae bacterium]